MERANEAPFALIEIKNSVYSFSRTLASDVERLHQALKRKSSLEVVCLALYSSASQARTKRGARETLEKRFGDNLARANAICANDLNGYSKHYITRADESEDCWGVQCIYFVRRTGRAEK